MRPEMTRTSGRRCKFGRAVAIMTLIAGVCGTPATRAAELYWTNELGGAFETGANWTNGAGAPPGLADNANFNTNASYTVTWGASVTNSKGYFNAQSGTATLAIGAGQTWTLTNQIGVGTSGSGGPATVRVTSGTISGECATGSAANDKIGISSSSNTIIVDGADTVWNSYTFQFANNGHFNRLIVTNGGVFRARANGVYSYIANGETDTAHDNQIIVTGTGSTLDIMNYFNIYGYSNSIIVNQGGLWMMTNTAFVQLGYAGTFNQIILSDPGTLMSNGVFSGFGGVSNLVLITNQACAYLYQTSPNISGTGNCIKVSGTGSTIKAPAVGMTLGQTLNVTSTNFVVEQGATATNLYTYVGGQAGGELGRVLVTDTGSVWNLPVGSGNECLSVARYDTSRGELYIRNGGKVEAAYAPIGRGLNATNAPNATGVVVVADAGSLLKVTSAWGSDSLSVGYSGQGFLTISNGGTVVSPDLKMGVNASSTNNWIEINKGYLYVTNAALDATMLMNQGTMTLREGGLVTANKLTITNTSTLKFVIKDDVNWGQIFVTNAFAVTSTNAALIVDISEYRGAGGDRTLVTYGSMTPKSLL